MIGLMFVQKPCDVYGGMVPNETWSCQCAGLKVTMQNQAPVDGLTITRCAGLITEHHCSKPDGKPHIGEVLLVPCETKTDVTPVK